MPKVQWSGVQKQLQQNPDSVFIPKAVYILPNLVSPAAH